MANPDAAFGFRPKRHLDGSSYNGAVETCHVPATDGTLLGIGDAVKLAGSGGSVDGVNNFLTVTRAAAGDAVYGVMVSNHVTKHDDTIYRAASESRDIRVCLAHNMIFECQEDSTGSNLAVTDQGNTADFVVAAGADTVTGRSKMEIDSSDVGTGGGLTVLRLSNTVRNGLKNAIGANAVWEVRFNESQAGEATVAGV